MRQQILALLNCKYSSSSFIRPSIGLVIFNGAGSGSRPIPSLQHTTLETSKHWLDGCRFPYKSLNKYRKSWNWSLVELKLTNTNLGQGIDLGLNICKHSLRLIESLLLYCSRLSITTAVLNMAELPLKSISLNSVAEGINQPQVEKARFSNGTSPVKCSLKRKSSSLERCYDDKTKENCSSSESSTLKRSPNKKIKRPFTVSIEGNIGSGKSTFLKYFSKNPNIATYQEPIEKWINLGGHNLLGKLYEDPDRWNFLFQSFVQLTRLKIHLDQPNVKSKLIERSFHNNRFCFLEHAHDSGNLNDSEFNVLKEYYEFFDQQLNIGIDLIVYLRTTPEVVFERMKKRGRTEEASVSLEYLQSIHKYYERWLMDSKPSKPPASVLVINGDLDLETLLKEYEKHLPVIIGQKKYENGHSTKSVTSLLDTPEH